MALQSPGWTPVADAADAAAALAAFGRLRLSPTRAAATAAAARPHPPPTVDDDESLTDDDDAEGAELRTEVLLEQANDLLARAGLLAEYARAGGPAVPPLGSLADLRAAAPALAVAVFEGLFEVRLGAVIRRPATPQDWAHNVDVVLHKLRPRLDRDGPALRRLEGVDGPAVALWGDLEAMAALLAGLRELDDRLFVVQWAALQRRWAEMVARGEGAGEWEGEEGEEEEGEETATMIEAAAAPEGRGGYGWGNGGGADTPPSPSPPPPPLPVEAGWEAARHDPAFRPSLGVDTATSAPAPPPPLAPRGRPLERDLRRARLRRQGRLHALRVERARALRQAEEEAARREAERLRRETAAALALRRVAAVRPGHPHLLQEPGQRLPDAGDGGWGGGGGAW